MSLIAELNSFYRERPEKWRRLTYDRWTARIKRQYKMHRVNATGRKIRFLLSFDQWLSIWVGSGHLGKWGRSRGQYHMARHEDKGAYTVGNVRIITAEENHREMRHTEQAKIEMSLKRKGRSVHSQDFKLRQRRRMLISNPMKTISLRVNHHKRLARLERQRRELYSQFDPMD